jgi:hypothetical protein
MNDKIIDKIRNYQTSSVQSLILQSHQDNLIYNSVDKGESGGNNINDKK